VLLDSWFAGIVLMNVSAVALVVGRAVVFHTRLYRPMLLNIGLSIAPIVVLGVALAAIVVITVVWHPPGLVSLIVFAVMMLVWLLFLPNAAYLITELNLNHRKPGEPVPEWYDVLLVLTLAMSGVLNTMLNVFAAQLVYVAMRFDKVQALAFPEVRLVVAVVIVLVSFGIYLGRHVRVNSWDVRHPWSLARKVGRHLHGRRGLAMAGFTVATAVFLTLMYLVVVGPIVSVFVAQA